MCRLWFIYYDLLFLVFIQRFDNGSRVFPFKNVDEPNGKSHKTGNIHQALGQLLDRVISLGNAQVVSIPLFLASGPQAKHYAPSFALLIPNCISAELLVACKPSNDNNGDTLPSSFNTW